MNNSGSVIAKYILASPVVHTDIIRGHVADQNTIDDTVVITGNATINGNCISRGFLYDYSPVAVALNTNAVLSYSQLSNGILTGLNVAAVITYTLPLGIYMGSNIDFLGNGTSSQYNQSFQWSILNLLTSTGILLYLVPRVILILETLY